MLALILCTAVDLITIVNLIKPLDKSKVTELGAELGLDYRWLRDNESRDNYRLDVVSAWLNGQDNVENVCPPTWRNLEIKLLSIHQVGIAAQVALQGNKLS